jgi:hypothetical protein
VVALTVPQALALPALAVMSTVRLQLVPALGLGAELEPALGPAPHPVAARPSAQMSTPMSGLPLASPRDNQPPPDQ